ncbi:hypothetical protein GS682_27295 [Nostoc sp. B(2019)]|nr:hypothetical protein [Nostoc sp. B(2019)]
MPLAQPGAAESLSGGSSHRSELSKAGIQTSGGSLRYSDWRRLRRLVPLRRSNWRSKVKSPECFDL